MSDVINKAFGLPEGADPNHEYVYRSGEHGIYDFWYKDKFDNYWLYSNAPKGHKDYDPYGGEAILVPDQPMPHTAPQFYTPEGRKLSTALPVDAVPTINEAYDPLNPRSIWYGMYQSENGDSRFLYYDSDVRENLDLWVQYQLRVVDSVLVRYRKYASQLFQSPHPKDKVVGLMLMLADQGIYEAHELTQFKVEDVEYIDTVVKLGGRKIVGDPGLVDFFTSLTAGRDPNEPLFMIDTRLGRTGVGVRHLYSIFKALRMSPHFLQYWHASSLFSRILHRMAAERVPFEEVEAKALNELSRVLGTSEDVSFMVDVSLKDMLLSAYKDLSGEAQQEPSQEEAPPQEEAQQEAPPQEEVGKSLSFVTQDDFGVLTVWSDLTAKRPDEFEFSQWLHSSPLHDMSEEGQAAVEIQLEEEQALADQEKDPQSKQPNVAESTAPEPSEATGGLE